MHPPVLARPESRSAPTHVGLCDQTPRTSLCLDYLDFEADDDERDARFRFFCADQGKPESPDEAETSAPISDAPSNDLTTVHTPRICLCIDFPSDEVDSVPAPTPRLLVPPPVAGEPSRWADLGQAASSPPPGPLVPRTVPAQSLVPAAETADDVAAASSRNQHTHWRRGAREQNEDDSTAADIASDALPAFMPPFPSGPGVPPLTALLHWAIVFCSYLRRCENARLPRGADTLFECVPTTALLSSILRRAEPHVLKARGYLALQALPNSALPDVLKTQEAGTYIRIYSRDRRPAATCDSLKS
ncbi:unnamed protein product [Parajaminaea phylloscopi]